MDKIEDYIIKLPAWESLGKDNLGRDIYMEHATSKMYAKMGENHILIVDFKKKEEEDRKLGFK